MFESARLTDAHTLEGFDCGKESLNTWLIAHARRADSSRVAHVYVWTPLGEQKVSAYFAICPTEVVRNDDGLSGSMAGGYSRIPGYVLPAWRSTRGEVAEPRRAARPGLS